jgi:hypothetical protein
MDLLKTINKRYKDGILLNWIYQILKKTDIVLYYLVQEGFYEKNETTVEPKLNPLEVINLDESDIFEIAANPERDYSENRMLRMLEDGCGCMGIRYKNEIVAYTWYDLNQCSTRYLTFKLKEDEAYLYAARTFSAYKGQALAPYLRHEVYHYLAAMGRTKLYSITLFENTPSIMFKKKINARNLKLFLWVRLIGKYQRNIPLRRYK